MNKAISIIILLFITSPVFGTDIHVEWGYTPPTEPVVSGFKLYQEGVYVCQTVDPNAIEMDCIVTLTKPTTNYTLTATFVDGTESPHSAPYAFTTPLPGAVPAPQIFRVVEVK